MLHRATCLLIALTLAGCASLLDVEDVAPEGEGGAGAGQSGPFAADGGGEPLPDPGEDGEDGAGWDPTADPVDGDGAGATSGAGGAAPAPDPDGPDPDGPDPDGGDETGGGDGPGGATGNGDEGNGKGKDKDKDEDEDDDDDDD